MTSGIDRPWSPEEIGELFRLLNEGKSFDQIGQKLGRTRRAIQNAKHRYSGRQSEWSGDFPGPRVRWSPKEMEILHANGHLTNEKLAELLHHRTPSAIREMRQRLGILGQTFEAKTGRIWTREELSILAANIDLMPGDLVKLLPVRSKGAIETKRSDMKNGLVEGFDIPKPAVVVHPPGVPFDTGHGFQAFVKPGSTVTLVYLPTIYG